MFERSKKGEHALLIQPHAGGPPDDGALEEFAELAARAGWAISQRWSDSRQWFAVVLLR